MNGWLALSPLALFLCIYLISSVVAADFYKVPIAAAFLLASAIKCLLRRHFCWLRRMPFLLRGREAPKRKSPYFLKVQETGMSL